MIVVASTQLPLFSEGKINRVPNLLVTLLFRDERDFIYASLSKKSKLVGFTKKCNVPGRD